MKVIMSTVVTLRVTTNEQIQWILSSSKQEKFSD